MRTQPMSQHCVRCATCGPGWVYILLQHSLWTAHRPLEQEARGLLSLAPVIPHREEHEAQLARDLPKTS